MREHIKKISGFIFVTIILVFIIAFCTAGTVKSISKEDTQAKEAYYQEMEKEYLAQVRTYLNSRGFFNSGVTMTRITTEEGVREYSVVIHNSRINALSDTEKTDLKEDLEELYSGMEECIFSHEFLEADL